MNVVHVVHRLLDIIKPDKLYMGQKDFQQTAVVRRLIDQLGLPVEFVMCPTMREEDGLAMSSRNVLLDPESRALAPLIFKALSQLAADVESVDVATATANARKCLSIPEFELEYLDVVDGKTLQPVSDVSQHDYVVACCALMVGGVRLIDNVIVKSNV